MLVVLAGLFAASGAGLGARADHDVPVAPDVFPKIRELVSPLAGAPAIVEAGTTLRVELDVPVAPFLAEAVLRPSFSDLSLAFPLGTTSDFSQGPSALWPGRNVFGAEFDVPAFGGGFVEDLYDLEVTWNEDGLDRQHRAVKVVEEIPASPRIVILADPSVGDPRPTQEGAEELVDTGDPSALIDKTVRTIGIPPDEQRWAALRKAIDEINLVQPDFVLVAGDLTFAIYPRPANVEYEDAFEILSLLQVPTFLTPGNHDLYDLDYDDLDRPHTTDGWELWQQYFGPLYYSVDIGPDLHLVSINTYDWPTSEREPFDESSNFSTRAGGSVRLEQFEWLIDDFAAYRTSNPDGSIVTFAHHDPSWIQARHPWAGERRLEVRDLMATAGVGVHFAGHTHEDRVARYHVGNVVETNGRRGTHGELHRVLRNDTLDEGWTQDALGSIIHDPSHGPLFVTTTTVSSVLKGSDWGLGGYWGWRYGTLERVGDGFDPVTLGYPATRAFLDAFAERPERWNVEHAEFGVFSYPSYHLDAEMTPGGAVVTNDLLVPMELIIRTTLAGVWAPEDFVVSGGSLLRARSDEDETEVWVSVPVAAGSSATVTVVPA